MLKGIDKITKELEKEQKRFEEILSASSKVIRLSAQLITAIHSKNKALSSKLKKELENEISELRKKEKGFEYYSMQAHQEYVEAIALYNIIRTGKLPERSSLKEGIAPYILGIMDLVGELKREAMDELREGKKENAEKYYKIMKEIYDSTLHIRFANSILPGFRKKQDVARIQLESIAMELLHIKS
jgi:translin